jgi:hypothetical protein
LSTTNGFSETLGDDRQIERPVAGSIATIPPQDSRVSLPGASPKQASFT